MSKKRDDVRAKFYTALASVTKPSITVQEIKALCAVIDIKFPYWYVNEENNKIKHGVYKVPDKNLSPALNPDPNSADPISMMAQIIPIMSKNGNRISNVISDLDITNLVPEKYKNYVPFGNFEDILSIVMSGRFFPVFISGPSGNGKTLSVEQACARAKRKFVCVSMTQETDEGDLLGNYVLIDGNMEWRDGPVTTAARQGAVLLIDEIDYGAQNLSCLQRVLEGKPFMLKKKSELIVPAPGFTVVATANTKGKGSGDGRYMYTNILNEAFLERFRTTMEQAWPPANIERKIISAELSSAGKEDKDFADKLVLWADVIRKTFEEGGCDELISTRRLVHIVETYAIFDDKMKAIQLCLNRFDEDTKASFLDLYTKVDAGATMEQILEPVNTVVEEPADSSVA